MRLQSFFAAVFIAVLAMPAIAQNPPANSPARIRGTVEKLDGQALTVKSREGQQVTVTLAPNVTVAYLVKKNLGASVIDPGGYTMDSRITPMRIPLSEAGAVA